MTNEAGTRTRDLTPTQVKSQGARSGGAGAFLQFLETELVPRVDATYRKALRRGVCEMSLRGG